MEYSVKRRRLEAVSKCKTCLDQKEETNFLVRENKRFRYSLLEKENELLDQKLRCVEIKQEVQRLDEENNLSAMPKEELKAELEKVIKENLELEKSVHDNSKLKEKLAFAEQERLMLNSNIVLLKKEYTSLDRQLISEQLENAVLSSKLSSSERYVQKLLDIINQLRNKLAEMEAEKIKFRENRDEVTSDHRENAVLSFKLSDSIKQLRMKVAEMEAEKNKLEENREEENRRLQIQVLKSIKDKVQMNLALHPVQDDVSSRNYVPAKGKNLPAKSNKSKRELEDKNHSVTVTTEGEKIVTWDMPGEDDKELRDNFCELLGEHKEIQVNTGWGEVEAVLQGDPRCQAVKKRNNRMLWFLGYVQDMKVKKEGKRLQGSQGKVSKDQHASSVTGKTTTQPRKKVCSSKRLSYKSLSHDSKLWLEDQLGSRNPKEVLANLKSNLVYKFTSFGIWKPEAGKCLVTMDGRGFEGSGLDKEAAKTDVAKILLFTIFLKTV